MLNRLINKVTIKMWLLFLILSQAIYLFMQIYTIPRIRHEAAGLFIFDMKPLGYTHEYATTFLSHLTEKGYELYTYVQLPLDLLFPLLNCLTGLCTFILLTRLSQNSKSKYSMIVLSLPFIAMVADYLENIMIFIMLSYKSAVPIHIVYISDIFTICKSISTTIFYMIIIFLCIIYGITWIKNRNKEQQTNGNIRSKREEDSAFESIDIGRDAQSTEKQKSQ
ncbi:hypothetical protein SAMN05880501_10586 [Ureibacillus xyleni]|uniref:Uncharacterized protein n=1 Tax=Ureibacillus xyleni TaxID=614648 RepID=A0A285SKK4_9BACL|nr:hypothetical protein [Ureibacillus xyleni]SOC08461.1 hypothetical protein SAMN05880501_10586 [Ureibacillus xyleni]